jgi:hypothetical protein
MPLMGRVRDALIAATLAITAAACMMAGTAAGAPASKVPHERVKIVRPTFRRVAVGGRALAAGDLVLITHTDSGQGNGAGGTLIDQATGTRIRLSAPPGCDNDLFGGGYLLYACNASSPDAFILHNAITATDTPLSPPGAPVALGRDWVRVEHPVDQMEYSPTIVQFQNLRTGVVRADPERSGGHTIANLDTRGLTETLCEPIRIPPSWDPHFGPIVGSLSLYGPIAISSSVANTNANYVFTTRLQRCGSPATQIIDREGTSLVANRQVVLWQSAPDQLAGFLLPSEQPIQVNLPRKLHTDGLTLQMALSNRTLYLNERSVWATNLTNLSH